jgi:hypothetical protein
MNTNPDLDRSIAAWLVGEVPGHAPEHLLAASRARIDAATQRGPWARFPGAEGVIAWKRSSWFGVAAAVVVVILAGTLASRGRDHVAAPTGPALPSAPLATPAPMSMPPRDGAMRAGRYLLAWPHGPTDARISVTVPDGWRVGETGLVYKNAGRLYGFPVDMGIDDVTQVATSLCALDESTGEVGPVREIVGPTVDDLVTAIGRVVGTRWSVADATLGGYRGKRLETTYTPDCPGPSRRDLWGDNISGFFLEEGVTSSIYVVDVDGDRLVVSTHERTTNKDALLELDAVVASIGIEPGQPGRGPRNATPPPTGIDSFPRAVGPDADLRVGRHSAVVDGIPFTFDVPTSGWEPQLGFYVSKSTYGSQGAEATLRWTRYPNGTHTQACPGFLNEDALAGGGAHAVAAAVAAAPGLNVVSGPTAMTIDGRPAWSVAVLVANDLGCDPGYFYTYDAPIGGALWTETRPNDTIDVWVVELDGRILFVEGEQRAPSGQGAHDQIQQIVTSMHFE